MPAICQWPETADEGGLMVYGPSLLGAFRQVTALVVKILKGAKPGDLPVEQPTRFALHLNLKAAKELGLEVPASFLLRVDKAVELGSGSTAAWPLASRAQQGRVRRVGIFMDLAEGDVEGQARVAAFRRGMSELGWEEGRNVRFEYRWTALF